MQAALARLRSFEESRRELTDFATLPAPERRAGADPHRLVALGDAGVVGILRGADAVVLLDASGRERQRLPAPASPSSVVQTASGRLYVAGEHSADIHEYGLTAAGLLAPRGVHRVRGVRGIVDLAAGPGELLYAVEELGDRLVSIEPGGAQRRVTTCHGPIGLLPLAGELLVNCLHDHQLRSHRRDASGHLAPAQRALVTHDGPLWAMAGIRHGERTLLAVTGVENHPLDRSDGAFGYIDSFLYLYALTPGQPAPTLVTSVNLSELGVVTPKALSLHRTGSTIEVTCAGYASDRLLRLRWPADAPLPWGQPAVQTLPWLPGTTALIAGEAGLLAASPLLDGWVHQEPAGARLREVEPRSALSPPERIGELLFFTTLMAPWNSASGRRSRFTCETCHLEGYGDGRVHYTGRGQVHASTRPLRGLFNNRPHFSRALDRSMTQMVHNEFRVASAGNAVHPWFTIDRSDAPWLQHVPGVPDRLEAEFLRRSLMAFLMSFTHRPNLWALGRRQLDAVERTGQKLFLRHCERCHSARLIADRPASRVPYDRWQSYILSPAGAIVWASSDYQRTGVEPYVHELGARTPSLRRLYKKWPYFTNGSARSISAVLEKASWLDGRFYHDRPPAGSRPRRLDEEQRAALEAFLRLL